MYHLSTNQYLEISVENVTAVEVIDAQDELQDEKFNLPLRKSCFVLLLQDEGQFPAAHEWHDEIEPFAGLEEEEEVG